MPGAVWVPVGGKEESLVLGNSGDRSLVTPAGSPYMLNRILSGWQTLWADSAGSAGSCGLCGLCG